MMLVTDYPGSIDHKIAAQLLKIAPGETVAAATGEGLDVRPDSSGSKHSPQIAPIHPVGPVGIPFGVRQQLKGQLHLAS